MLKDEEGQGRVTADREWESGKVQNSATALSYLVEIFRQSKDGSGAFQRSLRRGGVEAILREGGDVGESRREHHVKSERGGRWAKTSKNKFWWYPGTQYSGLILKLKKPPKSRTH